jgi:hypothetical protein
VVYLRRFGVPGAVFVSLLYVLYVVLSPLSPIRVDVGPVIALSSSWCALAVCWRGCLHVLWDGGCIWVWCGEGGKGCPVCVSP